MNYGLKQYGGIFTVNAENLNYFFSVLMKWGKKDDEKKGVSAHAPGGKQNMII